MGVGKSTIARILSKMLGVREYDTDRMIVAREGREISKIFEEDGELAFRKMETDLLEDLKGYKPSIIACGGGVAMRTENVESMKRQGKILLPSALQSPQHSSCPLAADGSCCPSHVHILSPGQLPVNKLEEMLDMIHQNYQ